MAGIGVKDLDNVTPFWGRGIFMTYEKGLKSTENSADLEIP